MATRSNSQSKGQKGTVSRVMHEFKHGELRTRGTGPKVKSRRQAIAIALSESGSSNQQSARRNASSLQKTKAKERRGETAEAMSEGKRAQTRTMEEATARKSTRKSPARKATTRKTTARKSAAKKSVARKSGVTKSGVRKSAVKKTAAGKTASRNARTSAATRVRSARGGKTKAMLYAEARRKKIPGRSHMSKGELVRALG